MPQPDRDEQIAERLAQLTAEGHLPWEPYYGEVNPQEQGFDEMTEPNGYLLIDNEQGFGVVTLRLHDPVNEIIEDPRIFMDGDALAVGSYEVGLLRDAIEAHLGDVRSGEKPTQQQKMQQKIQKARRPLKEKLEEIMEMYEEERERVNSLMETLHNMTAAPSIPLTPDTFRQTLRQYIDETSWFESSDEFEEAFDPSKAETAVEEIHASQ